jgi:Arc/MetJ family transcription regulator
MCKIFPIFVYKIKEMYKRTNIEIDLNLVKEVMEKYRLKTIKEAVNFSLERTIESKKRKNLLQLKGKVKWEGNLDEIRPSQKISFAKTG